ncbi:MAG: aspartate aminotransferase family protein [Syntrophorhabdaceae bacterium]|nr:aspartate aminotransferase family protein [Syntrophorhabdaceae bacterium]MDD4196912.1 aspartate aminotransferase family protein [Syntrophorhabdaceae bacterium]
MQEELVKKATQYIANTYTRFPIAITRGEGCWLWDVNGRRYLDFLAGIAVCNLGHVHEKVVEGLAAQAKKLFHVSNLFYMEPQIKAAQMLVENSFGDKVFFCNSGAEANEAAIKLARRYSWSKYGEGRHEIIAMENSFHGRTVNTLAATGQKKFGVGFEPLTQGYVHVPFNDIEALKNAVTQRTCAVMLELVQAEGGVYVADTDYVRELREYTKGRDIVLILDEVQTGIGRTGRFFAYEHFGIEPDIMSLAKALGNGFPVGAIVATDEVMKAFVPGSHASTFGGNPLASAAVLATLNTIIDDKILKNAVESGEYLYQGLLRLQQKFPFIVEIRGMGLIRGIELSVDGDAVAREFLAEGIVLNCTKGTTLRLVPPLIIQKEEIDLFLEIADRIFERKKA